MHELKIFKHRNGKLALCMPQTNVIKIYWVNQKIVVSKWIKSIQSMEQICKTDNHVLEINIANRNENLSKQIT